MLKAWIVTVSVAAAVSPARADNKNEIRAVSFDEDAGTTRIHVRGAQTPTFTVYKLERPTRVVIDLPQARLADALRGHETAAMMASNTWAVSTIAAQQLDDGGQVVRVIVTLARPGRYDVKTDGNEVVVMVTARDVAPKTASPEALAKAEAESTKAKQDAASADKQRVAAQADAAHAQAEAERLRKAATEQAAKADAAQRAADEARRNTAASAQEIEIAKRAAVQAQDEAMRAKSDAAKANALALAAQTEAKTAATKARAEAEQMKQDAARELVVARQAQDAAAKARAEAEAAKQDAAKVRADASKDAAKVRADADAANAKVEAANRRALEAEAASAKARADAEARAAAATAKLRETETASAAMRADADARTAAATAKLRDAAAAGERARVDAEARAAAATAKLREAEGSSAAARADAEARAAAATTKLREAEATSAKLRAEADAATAAARRDAETKVRDAEAANARLRAEAEAAKQDAAKARAEAAADKRVAEADKQKAEVARADAEKMMRDARAELATLDRKTASAQQMEDKARAAHAAALAREEAAREAAERAAKERLAAEDAAKHAADARDRSSTQLKSERDKLAAEAQAAEQRLAAARKATEDAEKGRVVAEAAQAAARADLDKSKTALASVEHQRAATESAAADAAKKRSDAEAAATDATRRRGEAELAATEATKKRGEAEAAATKASRQRSEAESQRLAAEQDRRAALDAAHAAQAAKDAAEQQRKIAETAARTANDSRTKAEASLADLTAKRDAAETAAIALETRSKAEAKAQAELAAAKARKAGDAELAKVRAEAARLEQMRKIAESELADRRKDVAAQQAQATKLELAATNAKDAATREDARRTQLAQQRAVEEQELARIKAQRVAAAKAPAPVVTPIVVPTQPPVSKTVTSKLVVKPNAKISDIAFRGTGETGDVTIALAGDANVELGEVTATTVELIVDHAELGAKLERKLDVSKLGTPLRTISSFRDRRSPDRVRLIAELASPATPTIDRGTNTIRWHFAGAPQVVKHAPPPQPVGGFGAASTPVAQQSVSQVPPGRRHIYHGQTVSFDIKDAPIHDLLRLIAETGHINIIVPDTIDYKVTVKLNRVPWDQALEVILQSHGLWYRREGNLYRVATRKEIDTEDKEEAERRAAMIAAESPRTEVVPLNYGNAKEMSAKFAGMLSPKGHIEVDDRTNALIINDVTGNRDQIAKLALQLDTQTPQISIEARIVEARSTFTRQFGIQWGGNANSSAQGGNATGLIFPSSIGLTGANTDSNTVATGVASPSDFAVNMPAATGSGEGGAVGLALGSISGNFNINLRLSALEDSGTVRIISAPKVTVLNNKEAKISQGVSIPISVVSAAGAQTQFVQADLSLTVTPYVSQRDCAIAMNLNITKNEPDFVNVGARGDPSILTKTAKTSMLVQDGETSVLGGIYTRNTGLAYKKVPFLGDLPVLGWLFKNRRENDDRTEILVFITPKITNKALLRCQ